MTPLVSVLIPTFNRKELLARALETALAQTYEKIEVVVYNDGSTDGAEEIIAGVDDPRIRYRASAINRGECPVRNTLIDMAEGKYICWLDSDDLMNRHRVEYQVKIMEALSPPFLRCAVELVTKKTNWREKPRLAQRMRFVCPSTMTRLETARAVGYDTGVVFGCDVLWELEATMRFGSGSVLPYVLYYFNLGAPDRLSARYHTKSKGYDEFMRGQVAKKEALLGQIKRKGIERWPTILSWDVVKRVLGT